MDNLINVCLVIMEMGDDVAYKLFYVKMLFSGQMNYFDFFKSSECITGARKFFAGKAARLGLT